MSTSEDSYASDLDQVRYDLERLKVSLQQISKHPAPSTTTVDQKVIKDCLATAGDVKGLITKSVKDWKSTSNPKGKRKRKAQTSKGGKFMVTQTEKNTNAEVEELAAIGNGGFSQDLARVMQGPKYTIQEWFEGIMETGAPNMFVDATYGIFWAAAGIQAMAMDQMNATLANAFTDTLEAEVLKSIDQTRIGDIQATHLYQFFNEATTSCSAVNRRSRVVLLQHIVFSIHTLKAALGWSRLEKGDVDNGKLRIVRGTYAARHKAKGTVDYKSAEFATFAKSMKDYNTGTGRFLRAYTKLRSIVLLLPQLSPHRFISPHLGPRLKEAVADMNFLPDESQDRERTHRAILNGVITLFGNQTLAHALKDIDEAIAQLPA